VVDGRVALVTSANFTEAAYHRNIEAGIIVRHPLFVERLHGYFKALQTSGNLRAAPSTRLRVCRPTGRAKPTSVMPQHPSFEPARPGQVRHRQSTDHSALSPSCAL